MSPFPLHALASLLAARMLNGVVEGTALALVACVLLRFIRRPNSSTRFAVWFFTLLAVAIAPWLRGFDSAAASATANSSAHTIVAPAVWGIAFLGFWAVIAVIGLARVALGLWQLRKLRQASRAIDFASLDPELQSVWEGSRPSRNVELAVSDELRVPTAIGFFRPMVILPAWAMQDLSREELKSVLIHELAHLRRHDDWTNLAQKSLRAIFFFHPVVWWVERQLSLEREMACDDAVLAQTQSPQTYARCLVTMAEKSFLRRGLALAQAAVSRMRQTSLRVTEILQKDRSRGTGIWRPVAGVAAVLAIVSVAGLSRAPELIAFQDPASSVASVAPMPRVVMASYQQPRGAKALGKTKPQIASVSGQAQSQAAATAVQAKLTMPATTTAAANETRAATAPPAVLVVFQTEQFGAPGMVHWTVFVWHVEVIDPSQIHAGQTVPAKSI